MRKRVLGGVVAALLLAFDPAAAVPPYTPLGSMRSRGAVQVNGVPAPSGMNVYAGNRVVTARGAVAVLLLARGGRLALGSSTSTLFTNLPKGLLVKLNRGVVDVVSETQAPVLVQVGGVTIHAQNRDSAFEVVATGRTLRVVAQRGSVLAEAANQTVLIEEGKTMKTSVAPAAEGSGSRMRTVMILTGAAGAAGLAAAIHATSGSSNQTCVSPSQLSCP